MRNAVEKFEQMLNITEAWFDDFHNRMKNTLNMKYNQNQNVQQRMQQHGKDLESGAECKGLSKGPNNLFFSNVGGASAIVGKNRNQIDDLGDLKISKRELRCYDLQKDKFGIAWLFSDDAKFHAKKIWGQPGEIHFDGIWEGGVFNGIWHGRQEDYKSSMQNFQGTGLNMGGNPAVQNSTNQQQTPSQGPAPQVLNYVIWLNNQHTYKTLPEVIEMLANGVIQADTTQIFRDGLNKERRYVILSTLPEYPQIFSAFQRLMSKGGQNP